MIVVLLHALARTSFSMRGMARALERAGHETIAIDYRSTRAPLVMHAEHVLSVLARRGLGARRDLGFVGHSMGGVVIRALPLADPTYHFARAVTLGSPVNGSKVAELLGAYAFFRAVYGPAFAELTPAFARTLPPAAGPIANIAGTRRAGWVPAAHVLRYFRVDEPSDSTVLVREAICENATARAEVDAPHSFLPSNREVQRLTLRFLERGSL